MFLNLNILKWYKGRNIALVQLTTNKIMEFIYVYYTIIYSRNIACINEYKCFRLLNLHQYYECMK